jgi:hypothetical protein
MTNIVRDSNQTSRNPTDARTMSAGDFGFLRHFLMCLSFVRASVLLGIGFGGGGDGGCEDLMAAMPNLMTEQICLVTLAVVL